MEHERRTLRFTKAEGAQNDFLIVDDRDNALSDEQRAAFAVTACHRRRSVGGDGVIFIVTSDENDFRMEFYNPDGSHGSMCGNGGRTAALWAYAHGVAPVEMRFDVLGKTYRAEILEDGVRLYFPTPSNIITGMKLDTGMGSILMHYAHTGAPHAVALVDEFMPGGEIPFDRQSDKSDTFSRIPEDEEMLAALDVHALGATIRHHPRFQPAGANVNFVAFLSDGTLGIRTFEKGVEAETEACGTGNIAAAIIAHLLRGVAPPVSLRTHGGDCLRVGFDPPPVMVSLEGETVIDPAPFFSNLYLEGPARMVFEGEIALPEGWALGDGL